MILCTKLSVTVWNESTAILLHEIFINWLFLKNTALCEKAMFHFFGRNFSLRHFIHSIYALSINTMLWKNFPWNQLFSKFFIKERWFDGKNVYFSEKVVIAFCSTSFHKLWFLNKSISRNFCEIKNMRAIWKQNSAVLTPKLFISMILSEISVQCALLLKLKPYFLIY